MYEDDIDYARRRLNETLVRKNDGSPFFVEETLNYEGCVCHSGINYNNNRREMVKHVELNLEPVPLGFVNSSNGMLFVCRKPMRRDWRQGLSGNSVVVYGKSRDFHMKMLSQTINNQYPSFEKALGILETKKSVAFSRDFGLQKTEGKMELVYRKYPVGEIKDGVAVLSPNKFFLQQHLEETVAV